MRVRYQTSPTTDLPDRRKGPASDRSRPAVSKRTENHGAKIGERIPPVRGEIA
jgi:hypothetical protein